MAEAAGNASAAAQSEVVELKMIEIPIRCTGSTELALDEMIPLQGELKQLSAACMEKLKHSLIENGFLFPFFVWQDGGHHYYLDGHQRDTALRELQKFPEQYRLPAAYPAVYIKAASRRDAARAILLQSSIYGKLTPEALQPFLETFELAADWERLSSQLDFESTFGDLKTFHQEFMEPLSFEPEDPQSQGKLDERSRKDIQCPRCGHTFKA